MSEAPHLEQAPARMVAGALAHLARHMESGCPRAGYLAAMLLDQIANDRNADLHLRAHARELVDLLERDPQPETAMARETELPPARNRMLSDRRILLSMQ